MESHGPFLPLLIISVLAFVVPVLASRSRRLRLPAVVGEIVAGILIGRSGLNLIPEDPAIEFLALFGFTYLLFLSGLEIDFEMLAIRGREAGRRLRTEPAILGGVIFLGTFLLAVVISFFLGLAGLTRNPILMALILSTTSVGIVVPTLKDRGLTSTKLGQSILTAAVVADFATMLLLEIFAGVERQGFGVEAAFVLALFIAFFVAYQIGRIVRGPRVRQLFEELGQATTQIRVRGSFALILIFVALAEGLGAEVILGAFLAGAVISKLTGHGSQDLRHKLDAIGYGFFIPIFFIMVGVNFDLPELLTSGRGLLLVPVLVVAAYVVKLVPALVFRFEHGWRETVAAGALLSARLSLIIAAAAIGVRLNIISDAVNSAIILVAIVTSIISPILFSRLLPPVKDVKKPVVILGGAAVARELAHRLALIGEDVTLIDSGATAAPAGGTPRLRHIKTDEDPAFSLGEAGTGNAKVFIAASADPDENLHVARIAASDFGVERCLVVVDDEVRDLEARKRGLQPVGQKSSLTSALENLVRRPAAYAALSGEEETAVGEASVFNPEFVGRELQHLRLPGDCLISLVRRDGTMFIPHGSTRLQRQDRAVVVGSSEAVEETVALLETRLV